MIERFGRLAVLLTRTDPHSRHKLCRCRCDCGVEKDVRRDALLRGEVTSCGCLRRERMKKLTFKHGEAARGRHTAEYETWSAMMKRCGDPTNTSFPAYGARGITVCERWSGAGGFEAFLADMGRRPSRLHSIDRLNNGDGYRPDNCRWATRSEQAKNRRERKRLTNGTFAPA